MGKRKGIRAPRRDGAIGPVLRPLAWSALLSATVAAVLATPAYADPSIPATVPDAGSRPAAAGTVQLPGATQPASNTTVPATVTGPLATQIYNAEVEVSTLGDQLLKLREDHDRARTDVAISYQKLTEAKAAVANASTSADGAAAQALKDAAELPPGAFGSDLHGLSTLSRIQRGERSSAEAQGAERDATAAKDAESFAQAEYNTAVTNEHSLLERFGTLQNTRSAKETALLQLKQRNASQLALIEQQREADEQQIGAGYGDDAIAGKVAHPKALGAVEYARAQLGKSYLWGAEGPDRFDCSGLMWAAYRSVGYYQLPRVAKDQYYGTRNNLVPREALLPGDLVFFSSNGSPSGIHHVGMYIGGGKMIHSPTTGDVVKVSTVTWSRLVAATRVYGSVPAPSTSPTPTPTPTPTPSATRTPSPTPTTPKPTTPKPTTASPSPSPSPTPSPTTSPSPTASDSSSPSPGFSSSSPSSGYDNSTTSPPPE